MKRFLIKCTIFFLLVCLCFAPFFLILDPYNIFHMQMGQELVDNGVEPDKNFVKPLNVMRHMEDYDSLLFGSSRVGFLDVSRMNNGTYYDMMASEGVPAEHVTILKALIKRGFVPKNVLVGVDDISYFVDPSAHDTVLFRKMYPWDGSLLDKASFYLSFMDPITNIESLDTMREHEVVDEDWSRRLLTTGTENLTIVPNFNTDNMKPYWADYYMPREEAFEDIKELKELCDENGINLIVFTNPVYGYTYMQDIENGYLDFLDRLADITDYYNFSGFNQWTLSNDYYYENSHYTPELGNEIIDVIFYGKSDENLLSQGFGFHVTKENKDELLEILKNQAINYDIKINTFKDTINKER